MQGKKLDDHGGKNSDHHGGHQQTLAAPKQNVEKRGKKKGATQIVEDSQDIPESSATCDNTAVKDISESLMVG
ncbi:hypothetical protein ACH5RR_012546 [Cinchona calisaya]|uniref:Uncharacterized protein n=1 Tax=Cinchona calisaya TaxID=153742 RepID=A0ABD3ABF9_9GENT